MPKYPVFASYAQGDYEKHLERFVKEFRDALGGKIARPKDPDVAFFDQDGIKGGEEWSNLILEAVHKADVLLCLMSPTYFRRPWCGRELAVFLQRYEALPEAERKKAFIFPVWWLMPPAPRPLPPALDRFNYRDAGFPKHYAAIGIRGLARNSYWRQFRQMVDQLALLIAQTLTDIHRLPAADVVKDILAIRNALDEQQPYDVKLVALTPGGDAWRPTATEPSISEASLETERRLQTFIRKLDTGASFEEELQRAQAARQVILVVVDANEPHNAALITLNQQALPNLALLLVDVRNPKVGADYWLARMGPGACADAKASGLLRVASPGEMSDELERLVDEARRRLQSNLPAAKAEDPDLAANASTQGISTETQPQLTGPGR